jgi:ketosteroid isomerase-like protein
MSAEENKAIVRKALDGAGAGELLAALSEDVTWRIFGETQFSGTFNGKQELQDRLWGPLFEKISVPGETTMDLIIAEGDHVFAQFHVVGRKTNTGAPYDQFYCAIFELRDGKITRADEYMDTELINTAFGPKEA